jgi:hypothetical protein
MVFSQKSRSILDLFSSKQIFFVGGIVKSGTTWLQLLLDAHPNVSCTGEGHFFDVLGPSLANALEQYNNYTKDKNTTIFSEFRGQPLISKEDFAHLLASAIAMLLVSGQGGKMASALGEKTPDNVRCFAVIAKIIPSAKFVHLVRDGRDCAVSAWFHNLRFTADQTHAAFSSIDDYVAQFAEGWAADVAKGLDFAANHPDRCHTLRYEDLVSNTEYHLGNVLRFLGMPDDAAAVTNCCAMASFQTLSGGRQRGDEDRTSFFRKGVVGDWRAHVTKQTATLFEEKACQWLEYFGYS